ncbi:MAG: dihydrofolate reductase [Bacteroidales bacterium]|nr:dihydrofolate reductase [Bacteroidales bacterium]
MERKLMLFIAMSLDGFIAKKDGNIDFLNRVNSPGEDYGYSDFLENTDTVIWGRKTFDKVISFGEGIPHENKKVFVISRTRTGNHGHITYHGDVVQLVNDLKNEEGKNIYCDGGGEIVFALLQKNLIDTLIVSIIPHLLGSGIRLFNEGYPEQSLKFKRSVSFPSGLVQLWYEKE